MNYIIILYGKLLCVWRRGSYSSLVSRGSGRSLKNSFNSVATSWGQLSSAKLISRPVSKSSRSYNWMVIKKYLLNLFKIENYFIIYFNNKKPSRKIKKCLYKLLLLFIFYTNCWHYRNSKENILVFKLCFNKQLLRDNFCILKIFNYSCFIWWNYIQYSFSSNKNDGKIFYKNDH